MRHILTLCPMFLFWLVLSGKFDLFHLALGVISCIIVSFLSADFYITDPDRKGRFGTIWRFFCYIPWLLKECVLSTLHVSYLSLHPRMLELIEPTMVTFKTKLTSDMAKVTLANSITLTPGTITIQVTDDVFLVHALSHKTAASLPGEMEERLARVFREG